jgi:hypothetical protein
MNGNYWWIGLVSALLGAGIGSSVPIWWSSRLRRIERLGEITAMISEASSAGSRMRTLIRGPVKAPLYRLPSAISKHALPKLIGDGKLTDAEIDLLVEFSNKVDEINRGLERAGAAHAANPEGSKWLDQEYERNVAKAAEAVEVDTAENKNSLSMVDSVLAALLRVDRIYAKRRNLRSSVGWQESLSLPFVRRHPRTAETSHDFFAPKLTPKLTPSCQLP